MKVNAELVLTNVVALDAKTHEFVRGLKQSDFTIYENGKQQAIASFDFQSVDMATPLNEATVSGLATAASHRASPGNGAGWKRACSRASTSICTSAGTLLGEMPPARSAPSPTCWDGPPPSSCRAAMKAMTSASTGPSPVGGVGVATAFSAAGSIASTATARPASGGLAQGSSGLSA